MDRIFYPARVPCRFSQKQAAAGRIDCFEKIKLMFNENILKGGKQARAYSCAWDEFVV